MAGKATKLQSINYQLTFKLEVPELTFDTRSWAARRNYHLSRNSSFYDDYTELFSACWIFPCNSMHARPAAAQLFRIQTCASQKECKIVEKLTILLFYLI